MLTIDKIGISKMMRLTLFMVIKEKKVLGFNLFKRKLDC